VLSKWDQFRDIAHLHGDHENSSSQESTGTKEMWIEFYWQKKDWVNLSKYKNILSGSTTVRYRLYYTFLVISEQSSASQQ